MTEYKENKLDVALEQKAQQYKVLARHALVRLVLFSTLTFFPVSFLTEFLGIDRNIGVVNAAEQKDKKNDAEQRKYENIKTRKRQSVGQKCAKKLESAQKVLAGEEASEVKEIGPSTQQLNNLVKQLRGYLSNTCGSSYEKSQVYNLLGFVQYSLNATQKAVINYKAMIAEPDVDPRQKIDTHYTLAQLYMMQENYPFAARQLEKWMAGADVVTADGKVLLAQIYYELDRKNEALVLVNQAIDSVEMKGATPKENWWLLQKILYYEKVGDKKHNNKKVIATLKKLITHYPKHLYWHQLGGMYGQMEESSHRLASLDILYLDKALTKSRDLLSLAYLYLGADVPYKAAQIIQEGIDQNIIESSAKNLEVLGSAWQQARETEKALEPLKQAAEKSDTGKTWARLAMVYLDLDENTKAVKAAQNALKKGQLKYPSYTQMTLGNALVNLNCYRKAAEVFGKAAKYKKSQKTAVQWQTYVLGEADRRDSLIESGAEIEGCQLL